MASENNGENLCRLCLSPKILKFEFNNDINEFICKIEKYLYLSVKASPCEVCSDCYSAIENFHLFYERVHTVQKKLLVSCFTPDEELNGADSIKTLEEGKTDSQDINIADNETTDVFDGADTWGQSEENKTFKTTIKVKKKNLKSVNYISSDIEKKMVEFYNLKCEKCKLKFSSFNLLNKHYLNVHKMKGYIKCCKRSIRVHDKSYLRNHMYKHLHPDMCRCSICGKELSSMVTLRHHMILHKPEEERPFQCDQCEKKFCCRSDLKNHIKNIHKGEDSPHDYICDVCGKVFQKVANLRYHLSVVHLQEKRYICEVCARCFTTHSGLRTHMNAAHYDQGPIQCHQCNKWLKNPDTLHKHIQMHQQNKFPCGQCEKVCNTASSLRSHMVRHSEARPYVCSICAKSFKTRTHLKTHAVQHSGGSHHECPYCHKTFVNMSNYYTHRKRMHPGETNKLPTIIPQPQQQQQQTAHIITTDAFEYRGVIKTTFDAATTVILPNDLKAHYCAF